MGLNRFILYNMNQIEIGIVISLGLNTLLVSCERKGKYVRMTLHVEVEVNSKNSSPLKIELMYETENYIYGFKSLKRD